MSGGHSFSAAELSRGVKCDDGSFVVELVTPKTTLVPQVMFHAERAVEYLKMVGIAPSISESVVFSPEVNDRVAVMAIDKECLAHLMLTYGDKVVYLSPLNLGHEPKDGVLLELVGNVLYVRIFNGEMLLGEAIEVENDADMLYAVESINQVYHIYNMRVRAKGNVDRLKSCFKNLFTDFECE